MIDDSALPQLQALLDTEAMSARVGVRIDEAVLVRHKPGRRALVRYECADGALLAKLRVGHRAIRPFRLMRSFEAAGFTAPAAIRVAEPVICLPELSTWVQRVDSGTPGEVAAFEHPHCVGLAAAEAAVAIHSAAIAPRRSHDVEREWAIVEMHLDRLSAKRPDLFGLVQAVRNRCLGRLPELVGRPSCGIHRDFYPDQLLVAADHVTVVDFDLYCEGDPALDIGNFVAHLGELALRIAGDAAQLDSARQATIERFVELTSEANRRPIAIYELLSTARLAGLSVQMPGRGRTTGALLESLL